MHMDMREDSHIACTIYDMYWRENRSRGWKADDQADR